MNRIVVTGFVSLAVLYPVGLVAGALPMSRFDVPYGKPAIKAAEQHLGRDRVALFLALVKTESRFDPGAVSSSNAIGLCQILPSTAKMEFGVRSEKALKDPVRNLNLGARYLGKLLRSADGNVEKALSSYHSGSGLTDDWCGNLGKDCVSPFSRDYVMKVRKEEKQFKELLCQRGYYKKNHSFCRDTE